MEIQLMTITFAILYLRLHCKRIFPQLMSLAFVILLSLFIIPSLGTAGQQRVDILDCHISRVSKGQISSILSKNKLSLKFYTKSSNSDLYAIVIPFDIAQIRAKNTFYSIARVTVQLLKKRSGGGWDGDDTAKIISAVPYHSDRSSQKTTASKFSAAASAFSLSIGAGYSTSESYVKLYRTVSVHFTKYNTIEWIFRPFKDEPVQPGTYFVVGFVEIPRYSEKWIHIVGGCGAYRKKYMGLSKESLGCNPGETQMYVIKNRKIYLYEKKSRKYHRIN